MNKFEEEFKKSLVYVPDSSCLFDINIYRNIKDLDYICFVEGPTDPNFYNNILGTPISGKNLRYVRSLTTDEGGFGDEIGKDGVIKNYFLVNQNKDLKKVLPKSIFIVDHDYEGLFSEYYGRNEINEKHFSITPYYAFENFFLTDENVAKIFKYFNLSNKELLKFKKILSQFVEETSNYTRLKSSVTIACKKCEYQTVLPSSRIEVPYGKYEGKTMTPYHIFHFIFNNEKYHFYNKNFMELQSEAMLKSVKSSKMILDYYNNKTLKFINNRDFIRGHDVYRLLEQYLLQNFNINISPSKYARNSRYNDIIKLLNVKMKFVTGIGNSIE